MTTYTIGRLAAFLLLTWGIHALLNRTLTRRRTTRALRQIESFDNVTVSGIRQRELAVPLAQRVIQPGLKRLSGFAQRITPVGVMQRLDETLTHAGITSMDGPRLLAVKVLTTIAGAAAGVIGMLTLSSVAPNADTTPPQVVVAGIFAAFVGYYLPEWIVRSRADKRSQALQRALPDALDLLSISVTAGLGFEAAMDRVSREMRGDLGVELYRVVQEMRLGQSRAEALRGLSSRTNVQEIDSFVLAMVQAETFGVPIAKVLTTQAVELRIRRRQRAEEMAQKIPVKILFPLIACIFPVIFIVIMGPPGISIYNNLVNTDTPANESAR